MSQKFLNFKKLCSLTICFAALVFAPLFLTPYYKSLLQSILCLIGLAVSWYFFSGITKYVSLGSAAFFGVGVYVTAVLSRTLPFPIVLLLAGVIDFLFGLSVGLATLRLKGVYFAIFTYGLAELLNNAITFWEMKVTGTRGRFVPSIDIYYPIVTITFIIVLLSLTLKASKFGFALRMIGECEETAIHLGVNTPTYKTIGFAISCMFIGLLGAAFAPRWGYLDSGIAFNPLYSFMPVITTLFGGIGVVYGPIIGAVVISLLEEYLLTTFKDYFMIIFGSILIVIVLWLPEGVTGKLFRKKSSLKP